MRRPYRMVARATATAETRQRIVEAVLEQVGYQPFDQMTLESVAQRAGVTLQTVLRRFGSKEGLIQEAAKIASDRILEHRNKAPADNPPAAVTNLMDHYEEWGDRVAYFLGQERQSPAVRDIVEGGRAFHAAWVERTFPGHLEGLKGATRTRRRAQLIAVTDVYVWKLLRRDLGMSRALVEKTIFELLERLKGDR
jgi:AcrR family transcriptional regulator